MKKAMRSAILLGFLLICICATSTANEDLQAEFERWKQEFGRTYTGQENDKRYAIWLETRRSVVEHNDRYAAGKENYKQALNDFSDWTPEEKLKLLARQPSEEDVPTAAQIYTSHGRDPDSLPSFVNWTARGYVTSVKNQGKGGSCYAFAAVGAMEGQYRNVSRRLKDLSVQQIIDCDQGCEKGGYVHRVYSYVQEAGGIQTGEDYPHDGQATASACRFNKDNAVATVSEYYRTSGEFSLKYNVATIGPIAVSNVAVYNNGLINYDGSTIFYDKACIGEADREHSEKLNGSHAMLAVGYGTENGQDYWLIKNSWGPGWGLKGYLKMVRNNNSHCGIASRASYPVMVETPCYIGGNPLPTYLCSGALARATNLFLLPVLAFLSIV